MRSPRRRREKGYLRSGVRQRAPSGRRGPRLGGRPPGWPGRAGWPPPSPGDGGEDGEREVLGGGGAVHTHTDSNNCINYQWLHY